MIERIIMIRETTDTLSFHMAFGAARAAIASARGRLHEQRVTAARARPRHWSCERRPAEVRRYARQFLWLVPPTDDSRATEESHWHLPRDTTAFLASFAPITSARECSRLARAIDRQFGMEVDTLVAFRVGDVYLLPTLGDLGAISNLTGTVISAFVIPD